MSKFIVVVFIRIWKHYIHFIRWTLTVFFRLHFRTWLNLSKRVNHLSLEYYMVSHQDRCFSE